MKLWLGLQLGLGGLWLRLGLSLRPGLRLGLGLELGLWLGLWLELGLGPLPACPPGRPPLSGSLSELPESESKGFSFSRSTAGAEMSFPPAIRTSIRTRSAEHPRSIRTSIRGASGHDPDNRYKGCFSPRARSLQKLPCQAGRGAGRGLGLGLGLVLGLELGLGM